MAERTMRRLGIAVLLLASTAPVFAADLPITAPAYKVPVAIPAYDWTGFYAGVNLGYGTANDRATQTQVSPLFGQVQGESFKTSPAGVLGGAQAGYNVQISKWLLGIEADLQGTGQQDASICIAKCFPGNAAATSPFILTMSQSLPWFGTARGRVGVTMDNVLFYVTGGFAYGRVDTTATLN